MSRFTSNEQSWLKTFATSGVLYLATKLAIRLIGHTRK